MATRPNKFHTLLGLIPEVRCADPRTTTHLHKVAYTTISLLIILAASQIPLYGIRLQPYPLGRGNILVGTNHGTLFTLGIGPILAPEILKPMVPSMVMNVDRNSPEAHTLLNRIQKLMGIFFTIVEAASYMLSSVTVGKFGVGNAALVALQLLFSGISLIYLDDVLKKGYGLISCISLVTAASICGDVLWKASSPTFFRYPGGGIEYEGALVAGVHLLITRSDKSSAMLQAFYRQNLPNLSKLLATCIFVPIAIFFQGLSIVLPVRSLHHPIFQVPVHIKISNISYGVIILHHILSSIPYNISKLLYKNCGGNKFVNLLGTWKGFRRPVPDGGLAYYIAVPPTLSNLQRDPLHVFIYVVFVLVACALIAVYWYITVSASSKRFHEGFLVSKERYLDVPSPDSISPNEFVSQVKKAACFGGLCSGALIILGDLIGVFRSGTAIMLAVTTLYPYFDGRAGDVGAFGF